MPSKNSKFEELGPETGQEPATSEPLGALLRQFEAGLPEELAAPARRERQSGHPASGPARPALPAWLPAALFVGFSVAILATCSG